MSDQELLPCPFCGETPALNINVYSNDGRFSIRCKSEICEIRPSLSMACASEMWPDGKSAHYVREAETKAKIIETWNRRASAPELDREKLLAWLQETSLSYSTRAAIKTAIDSGRFDAPAASRGADREPYYFIEATLSGNFEGWWTGESYAEGQWLTKDPLKARKYFDRRDAERDMKEIPDRKFLAKSWVWFVSEHLDFGASLEAGAPGACPTCGWPLVDGQKHTCGKTLAE
jgi:hypothetical protein